MKEIHIHYVEDFDLLRNCDSGEYKVYLERNLDFDNVNCSKSLQVYFENKRKGFEPINFKNCSVIFEGNGCVIKNLKIELCNTDNAGLFNTDKDSLIVVKNLELEEGIVYGRSNVGLLGGTFNGTVSNCHISGQVFGYNNVGGIVGKSEELFLNSTTNDVDIFSLGLIGIVVAQAKKIVIRSCNLKAMNCCGGRADLIRNYAGDCENIEITGPSRKRVRAY